MFQDINNGEAKWVTTDFFDTDSNDKIIEHWDNACTRCRSLQASGDVSRV